MVIEGNEGYIKRREEEREGMEWTYQSSVTETGEEGLAGLEGAASYHAQERFKGGGDVMWGPY